MKQTSSARGRGHAARFVPVWILIGLVLTLPTNVPAQEALVYVDADALGANDGTSWADAYNHLQDALAAAADPEGTITEIRVADGTYVPYARTDLEDPRSATFQLISGVALYGGYAGFGQPDPDERNIEAYPTILSGDLDGNDGPMPEEYAWADPTRADNSYHVVTGSGTDETAVMDGLTITAGNANSSWVYGPKDGGGLYCVGGNMTLKHCTFNSNYAIRGGGGIYCANGSPRVLNCTFSDNATAADGAGMSIHSASPTLANCSFTGNTAKFGGGIYTASSSPLLINCDMRYNSTVQGGGMHNRWSDPTLIDCVFFNNFADLEDARCHSSGGGIYSYDSSPSLINCTLEWNWAHHDGGGIHNLDCNTIIVGCTFTGNFSRIRGGGLSDSSENTTLDHCTFYINRTWSLGGGMYNASDSALLTHCVFYDNRADSGGGLYNMRTDATLANCRFTDNTASSGGGGVYNDEGAPSLRNCAFSANLTVWGGGGMCNSGSAPMLTNCTFAGNLAALGQALACNSLPQHNPSTVELTNCILWDGGDEVWNVDGSTISIIHSIVEGGWDGVGNMASDPLFVDVSRDNLRLQADSPAIGAGDPEYVAAPGEADLDGHARVLCGRVDMGAYVLAVAKKL